MTDERGLPLAVGRSHRTATPAQWAALLLVGAWGLRLGLHLLVRAWGEPEDRRYAAERSGDSSSLEELLGDDSAPKTAASSSKRKRQRRRTP